MQDYGSPTGSINTRVTAPGAAGTYAISVWVRQAGSGAPYEVTFNGPLFVITP